MKAQTNRYSTLQYFLWLISGSEISLLKKCPTDFNRHAGIGFTILMTTLFGAFAGGYAGFYFSHSYTGAIIFGCIWGLLIFSIDRTMVVSLKKKPDSTWSDYAGQLVMRVILAILIAFIISIPLELLVFRDNIDAGLSPYKQDKEIKLQQLLDSLHKPQRDSAIEQQRRKEGDVLYQKSKQDPDDPRFQVLLDSAAALKRGVKSLESDADPYRDWEYLAAEAYKIKDSLRLQEEYNSLKKKSDGRKKIYFDYRGRISIMNADKSRIDSTIDDWRRANSEALVNKATKKNTEADSLKQVFQEKSNIIDSTNKKFNNDLAKMDSSFSVRFDVLAFISDKKDVAGNREYPSVFFLLWLIRVLFFIIEILPSVTKIATPFGAYDEIVFNEEKNLREVTLPEARRILEKEIQQDETIDLAEKKRQATFRAEKEQVLHDKIVERIIDSQDKMANKIITDWEKEHGI